MPTCLEIGKPIAISGNWQALGQGQQKGQQSPNMSKHQIQKLENVGGSSKPQMEVYIS